MIVNGLTKHVGVPYDTGSNKKDVYTLCVACLSRKVHISWNLIQPTTHILISKVIRKVLSLFITKC